MSTVVIGPANAAQILVLKHPHTDKPASFAVSGKSIYELRSVTDQESIIYNGDLSNQPVLVSVSLSPIYLLLPVLYANRSKPLPLSFLLEMLDQETNVDSMPATLAELACRAVCTCTNSDDELIVQLNTDLLKQFLKSQVDRISENCPESALRAFYPSLGFPPTGPPSEEIKSRSKVYCAVEIVVNSYLNEEVGALLLEEYNFDDLVKIARLNEIALERLGNPQAGVPGLDDIGQKKRPAPAARKTTKKTVTVTNNHSLLDMFRKK